MGCTIGTPASPRASFSRGSPARAAGSSVQEELGSPTKRTISAAPEIAFQERDDIAFGDEAAQQHRELPRPLSTIPEESVSHEISSGDRAARLSLQEGAVSQSFMSCSMPSLSRWFFHFIHVRVAGTLSALLFDEMTGLHCLDVLVVHGRSLLTHAARVERALGC